MPFIFSALKKLIFWNFHAILYDAPLYIVCFYDPIDQRENFILFYMWVSNC